MKIEYLTMETTDPMTERSLNALGDARWELVVSYRYPHGTTHHYVFKREKQPDMPCK